MRQNNKDEKVVIVVGAGSTYADATRLKTSAPPLTPPLNDRFFRQCEEDENSLVKDLFASVKDSLARNYKIDPTLEHNDNLEYILVKVYSDIHIPRIGSPGQAPVDLYLDIVLLLNLKLAHATNNLIPSEESGVAKIVSHYLDQKGFKSQNICIVTFNYDLNIEKNLHRMGRLSRDKTHGATVFNFPHLYGLGGSTGVLPSTWYPDEASVIDTAPKQQNRISLLKLHGSLNWVSTYDLDSATAETLFTPAQSMAIVPMLRADPYMVKSDQHGKTDAANPVIVPPIAGKVAVIPRQISEVWAAAEEHLRLATEVVIYGYSCPNADVESIHLLENTIANSDHCRHVSVINPDTSVVGRMSAIPKNKPVTLFPSVDGFLSFAAG